MPPRPQTDRTNQDAAPRRGGIAAAGRGLTRYAGRLVSADAVLSLGRNAYRWGGVIFTLRRRLPPTGPAPDFEAEMRRLGLSPRDLDKRRTQLEIETWSMFALAVLAIAWAVRSLLVAGGFSQIVFALASGLVALPLTALAASAAFRHWQIRTRRLGGWEEWLRTPGEWLP